MLKRMLTTNNGKNLKSVRQRRTKHTAGTGGGLTVVEP